MKLIKQKGPRCLLYAASMVLDIPPEKLVTLLGHEGFELHMQELQAIALKGGLHFALFEPTPTLQSGYVVKDVWGILEGCVLPEYLQQSGILLGKNASGNFHAVAWDGKEIFDPALNPSFQGYHSFWALY